MTFLSVAFGSLFGVVLLALLLARRGLQSIGLAPHKINFPGPKALPFFGNFLEASITIECVRYIDLLTTRHSFVRVMPVHSFVGQTGLGLSFALF